MREIIEEITSFRELQENWDGEGASFPSMKSIDMSIDFLGFFKTESIPTPCILANGNISLLWQEGADMIELEFQPKGNVAGFASWRGKRHKWFLKYDAETISSYIESIFRGD